MSIKDDVVVRVAQRRDVPEMVALLTDDMLGQGREGAADLEPYYEAWDEIILDPNAEILILDLDGRVVGMAQLNYARGLGRKGMRRCTIEAVRVASNLRSKGLGAILIENCLDMARARGCGMVQLTTDKRRTDAHRFYQRLGFDASHEGMKLYL
ncbi:GNAT family N-acetyltransferase [Niveispirillum cyanobacteriorum]|uniref:GNAT family N-acetyltransferase n=1 Tax=Niveispirillum cyanobacteriorum TaxID=1612173 RepID=A0A2K9NJZ1_9PROT|nr:GNAT family N-acetyltransferase [Niveispirillum cyanobacteriorum]AUN33400.1 GNAT family N-acetyltransferase [Niveispirillum cyanobacteriorum]GGE48960.1 GNAT family acetyltransferase [Niveispirillum cyanobacteriorum]